ncbi:hypothetical protein [Nostoc sp.]|uniref:hypothetical protein n=1 Tax=Nostoc sp. TaxID=1180 RepID=UPI002FF477E0
MSTQGQSLISSLSHISNCAGHQCDCCQQLQSQIDELKTLINNSNNGNLQSEIDALKHQLADVYRQLAQDAIQIGNLETELADLTAKLIAFGAGIAAVVAIVAAPLIAAALEGVFVAIASLGAEVALAIAGAAAVQAEVVVMEAEIVAVGVTAGSALALAGTVQGEIVVIEAEIVAVGVTAGSALALAGTAEATGGSALVLAGSAEATGVSALALAGTAQGTAGSALLLAGSAEATAGAALTLAGTAEATAGTALATAATSEATAITAETTALGAEFIATSAQTTAGSAFALAEVVQGQVIYAEAIANEALLISFELRGEIVLFEGVATSALTLATGASTTALTALFAVELVQAEIVGAEIQIGAINLDLIALGFRIAEIAARGAFPTVIREVEIRNLVEERVVHEVEVRNLVETQVVHEIEVRNLVETQVVHEIEVRNLVETQVVHEIEVRNLIETRVINLEKVLIEDRVLTEVQVLQPTVVETITQVQPVYQTDIITNTIIQPEVRVEFHTETQTEIKVEELIWFNIDVPVIVCTLTDSKWTPTRNVQTIQVMGSSTGNEALKVLGEYEELAKANTELCLAKNKDEDQLNAVVALPERYQLSPDGHIPQLICLFVEKREDGTLAKDYYPITIPHPKSTTEPSTAPLDGYKKGSWEGILTLKDNSKVFVNAFSKEEAEQVITQAKTIIDDKYTEGSFYKVGQRKGQPLKEINVKLVRVDYYAEGTKQKKPTWIKLFR